MKAQSSNCLVHHSDCAIVLCINHRYWPHAAVVVRSILINSPHHSYPIFIFYDQPDQAWISRIKRIGQLYQVKIELVKFDTTIVDDFKVFGRLSSAAYFRLFAPRLLPEYAKLLYLDSDLVVVSDLSQLMQTDLGSYPLAARAFSLFESTLINQRLLRESTLPYFNSGVLLINTKLWEEMSCTEHIVRIILGESHRLFYADQCALNLYFGSNYKLLPLEWNITRGFFESNPDSDLYSSVEIPKVKQALARPKIIHYTGDYKPWHIQSKHPLRLIYWKHSSFFHWYPYATIMRVCQLGYSIISMIEAKLFGIQMIARSFVRRIRARITI